MDQTRCEEKSEPDHLTFTGITGVRRKRSYRDVMEALQSIKGQLLRGIVIREYLEELVTFFGFNKSFQCRFRKSSGEEKFGAFAHKDPSLEVFRFILYPASRVPAASLTR
jgi:hypothetical protein